MLRAFITGLLLSFLSILSHGQELDCKVQVTSQQIQGTNKQIFQTLQSELFEFINNTKWTNHIFGPEERIDCNLMITITDEISADEFKGRISIQARRPVHNTNYNSVLINYVDNDFHIRYVEFEPLIYNESGANSNLISIVTYWIYIIIGLDYESFGLQGGSEFFEKAESIVNRSQNSAERGWKSFESLRNRYWLTENLLNNRYEGIRQCFYNYHRLGLDVMNNKAPDGRMVIAESLTLLQQVHRDRPGSFLMQLFFDAKNDELVNIFSESFPEEKNRVIQILTELDPSNLTKYNKLTDQGGQSGQNPGMNTNNPRAPMGGRR